MRKIVISVLSVIVLLAAVLLITPYFLGGTLEKQYVTSLKQAQKLTGSDLLQVVRYQRGWFSSTLELKVHPADIRVDKQTSKPVAFTLTQHISHGPITVGKDLQGNTHWHFGMAYVTSVLTAWQGKQSITAELFKQTDIAHAMTVINFAGHVHGQLKSTNINVKSPGANDNILEWQGMTGQWQGDDKQVTMSLAALPMQYFYKGTQLKTDKIALRVKGQFNGQWQLQGKLTAPSIDFNNPKQPQADFQLQKGVLSINKGLDKQRLNLHVNASFAKLLLQRQHYGASHIDLAVKDLSMADLSNPQFSLLQLLSKGVLVNLNSLEIHTPSGVLDAKGKFMVPELVSGPEPSLLNLLMHGRAAFALRADRAVFQQYFADGLQQKIAEGKLDKTEQAKYKQDPKVFVQQTVAANLAELVQSGFITPKGPYFTTRFDYYQRQFSLNGKALNR